MDTNRDTYLGTGVTMMVGIQFVLGNLIGKFSSDTVFRHLFTDSRVELAHLRSLSDLISLFMEIPRCLYGAAPCRRPNLQRWGLVSGHSLSDHRLFLGLAVSHQAFGHFLGVIFALLRERCIGFVGVCLYGDASLNLSFSPCIRPALLEPPTRAKYVRRDLMCRFSR